MTKNQSSIKPWRNHIVVSLLVIIYIAINVFRVGGDEFILNLNNNIVLPLAVAISVLAFVLVQKKQKEGINRLLWWGLFISWTFWMVAQFYWAIAAFVGQEIPYPSWADFFWIVGYIPMYYALWIRLRSLPRIISPLQNLGIWISTLVGLSLTIWFVLLPIIQYSDPSAILESVLNVLYPLLDLFLLILVLRIFFLYQPGAHGRAWIWFSAGFILMAFSDLAFSYATTAGLYYPDDQATLLSTLVVDVPYNVSFLFWLIGLLILLSVQKSHHPIESIHTPSRMVHYSHVLVFTFSDASVINVSRNFAGVFGDTPAEGKTIQELLGLSPQDADALFNGIRTDKTPIEREFPVKTRLGQVQAWISGMVIQNHRGEYAGSNILLRVPGRDDLLDDLLTSEQKTLVGWIMGKTGAKQKEEDEARQLLMNYYLAILQELYNLVFAEGGGAMADVFLVNLQSAAKQHAWQVGFQPDNLLDASALSLSEMRESLPVLLETARRFVVGIKDELTVEMVVENVRSKYDQPTLGFISHLGSSKP